jgi:NAD-dependent deacetylase
VITPQTNILVLSGAGISAESGLQTFRGPGGLWEGRPAQEVATPEAWEQDPERVLRFYNSRRQQVRKALPNAAHIALATLQDHCRVRIVTQNVDDLHERAGSTGVLHLHGEIMKAQSSVDPRLVFDLGGKDIAPGDLCPKASQLRPNVVWFGEPVPMISRAAEWVAGADILLVVGTSMGVYPAAGLVDCARPDARIVLVNPEIPAGVHGRGWRLLQAPACEAVPRLVEEWLGG